MHLKLTATEASWLLYDLCVSLGFCLPPKVQEKMVHEPPTTIDEFAKAVCLAEGLDPAWNKQLFKAVRARVAVAFEASYLSRGN